MSGFVNCVCAPQAPESWKICERQDHPASGGRPQRGLVPESFVEEIRANGGAAAAVPPPSSGVAAAAGEPGVGPGHDEKNEWLTEAERLIAAAGDTPKVAAVALAAYDGETHVDLSIRKDEQVRAVLSIRRPLGGDPHAGCPSLASALLTQRSPNRHACVRRCA